MDVRVNKCTEYEIWIWHTLWCSHAPQVHSVLCFAQEHVCNSKSVLEKKGMRNGERDPRKSCAKYIELETHFKIESVGIEGGTIYFVLATSRYMKPLISRRQFAYRMWKNQQNMFAFWATTFARILETFNSKYKFIAKRGRASHSICDAICFYF